MNNIYKVIWSKAKNCYVVASEIARSHTKSATGSKKIGGGLDVPFSRLLWRFLSSAVDWA